MFRFSLHPVLVVRKQAEDMAQRELAEAMKELARVQERIQGLENALKQAGRDRRQMMETRFMPARQELYAAYARDMRDQIAALRELEQQARKAAEQRRLRLIEASRRRQVMDEMKKAEYAAYTKKENADERKRNDDIAVFQFAQHKAERALTQRT